MTRTNLLVMKFGGTSMGSAERIRTAADLGAEQARVRPTVVVVSAMSKVTDLLLDGLRSAEAGDGRGLEERLKELSRRHRETCSELLEGAAREQAMAEIEALISEYDRLAKGILMLGERPLRSVDEAIAIGERLSAMLAASYLRTQGVKAEAVNAR